MQQIELVGLDKTLYYEKLDNNLEIYLLPYEEKENYLISYATKYGSDVISYKDGNEIYTPPLGVAHYLEHKLFEEPSGEDPFTYFSMNGSDGNASTSYDNTQYICYGTKEFRNNLRYLIKFVNNPYFTDENVNKEKGIISEEINMYNDIPDYQLEMKLRENIYKNSSRKYDIAGTTEEINRITKEDLYKCYNSFYIPNNMFILIAGKFYIDDALEVIKEELKNKEKKPLPKITMPKEPNDIVIKEETIYKDIEIPKLGFGIKVDISNLELDKIECNLYLNMYVNILFGSSSEFRERLRSEQLLNEIYFEWENIDKYKVFYLYVSSPDLDRIIQEIEYELSQKTVTKNNFERLKKVWIANETKIVDNIEKMESNLFDDIINYNNIVPNRVELIRKMDIKMMNTIIQNLDLTHRSIIKMLSKEEKENI